MNKHRLYEFLGARKTCYLGSVQCYINFCENCIVSTTARYKNYLSTIICRKIVILLCKTLEVHAWVHLICLLLASIKVSIVLLWTSKWHQVCLNTMPSFHVHNLLMVSQWIMTLIFVSHLAFLQIWHVKGTLNDSRVNVCVYIFDVGPFSRHVDSFSWCRCCDMSSLVLITCAYMCVFVYTCNMWPLLCLSIRESLRDYGMGMMPPFGMMERRSSWMMHDMPPGGPMPPGARYVIVYMYM